MAPKNPQARLFELRIVICVEIVETDHLVAALEQAQGGMVTDESGRAGDEQLHNLRHTVLPPDALSSSASTCSCAAISASPALITVMRMPSRRAGAIRRACTAPRSDSALNVSLACPPVMAKYTSARMRASSRAP